MSARDVPAGDSRGGLHHFLNGEPLTVTDIIDSTREMRNALEGEGMSLCDIHDVDIVANAGAVRCRIVRAIDVKALTLSRSHLQENRNNVSFRTMVFTKSGRSARRVEIAHGDVFEPSTFSHFRKHALEEKL